MANPKNVIKKIKFDPANIVKDASIAAVVAVAEGGKIVVDVVHDMKVKRREDAIVHLDKLEELMKKGTITPEEFEKKRVKLVKKI